VQQLGSGHDGQVGDLEEKLEAWLVDAEADVRCWKASLLPSGGGHRWWANCKTI
jgi:hypothetical protein